MDFSRLRILELFAILERTLKVSDESCGLSLQKHALMSINPTFFFFLDNFFEQF